MALNPTVHQYATVKPTKVTHKNKAHWKRNNGCASVCFFIFNYNLFINIRLKNRRTNLGNMYLDITYIINTRSIKAKITSFTK